MHSRFYNLRCPKPMNVTVVHWCTMGREMSIRKTLLDKYKNKCLKAEMSYARPPPTVMLTVCVCVLFHNTAECQSKHNFSRHVAVYLVSLLTNCTQ